MIFFSLLVLVLAYFHFFLGPLDISVGYLFEIAQIFFQV